MSAELKVGRKILFQNQVHGEVKEAKVKRFSPKGSYVELSTGWYPKNTVTVLEVLEEPKEPAAKEPAAEQSKRSDGQPPEIVNPKS